MDGAEKYQYSHDGGMLSLEDLGQIVETDVLDLMAGIEKDVMEWEYVRMDTITNTQTNSNIFIPGAGVLLIDE